MKAGRMQTKDIPDAPVLAFLATLGRWGTWFSGFENSVLRVMPEGTPEKLAVAKMRTLIKRGLVDGCCCGCRGDFELTATGLRMVETSTPLTLTATE